MAKGARELQFATHQLVVVFLGLIALCVFVFLLGISMGSKRASLAAKAGEKASRAETPASSIQAELDAQALQAAGGPLPEPVAPKSQADTPGTKTGASSPVTKPAVKPPAEKPEAKAKPAASAAGWFVQVSASDEKPAAETLARKLEKEGFPVVVMDPLAKDKKIVYRVRVGPYESKAKAEEAKAKLAEAAKKKTVDYFLVKG